MSRFKLVVGAVALTVMMSLLVVITTSSSAQADDWPPPLAADRCGTKYDQFYIPDVDSPAYLDSQGEYLPKEVWLSTGGAAKVTVTARNFVDPDVTFTLTFKTEPDSSCIEAPDTVTTQIVACNTKNSGTRVMFTYTNVDDATDRWHSKPYIYVKRWDEGQTAEVWPSFDRVQDGASASVTGGDADFGAKGTEFYLAPGTYTMKLRTDETGSRMLPNRLFVPACGDYRPPKGDPMGGAIPNTDGSGTVHQPRGSLTPVYGKPKMKMLMVNRKVAHSTIFKLTINRPGPSKVTKTFKLKPGKLKKRVFRAPSKTTFVLRAKVKVNRHGHLRWKWIRLDRNKIRSLSS